MDRRGHGKSGDGPTYSLELEARDVAAVVDARGRPVAVLGHSFGAVTALDAAFITPHISRLVLYEPPLRMGDATATLRKLEDLIRAGKAEAATEAFMLEIVHVSPGELAAMRERPAWKTQVSSIAGSIRQHRALMARKWDPARMASLQTPTLLMVGEKTQSAELKASAQGLLETLPHVQLKVLAGQEHNAMDTAREEFAAIITEFLKGS
jgi:pimeloyl-ACP methyl ester carboxylesterase